MRGLSGAVTALILVIASVIIALIVVGFAFNLFGTYATQATNTVSPVGGAYLYVNKYPNGSQATGQAAGVFLVFTVTNKGSNVNITSVSINGAVFIPYNEYNLTITSGGNSVYKKIAGIYIPTGTRTLMLNVTTVENLPNLVSGGTVPVELRLSNGLVLELNAYVYQ